MTLVAGLGIAGIWGTYALWMLLRALCNHWRADRLLQPARPATVVLT